MWRARRERRLDLGRPGEPTGDERSSQMSATVVAPVEMQTSWTRGMRAAVAALVLVVMLAGAFAIGRASVDASTTSPTSTHSGSPAQTDVNRIGKAF
jgi:hypothetical protein